MIGIHKGYDPVKNRNVCTIISKEMIRELKKWEVEMNLSFLVEGAEFSVGS